MNQQYSTIALPAPVNSQPLSKITTQFAPEDSSCFEFQVHGVGKGRFRYSDQALKGEQIEYLLLDSLIWNENVIELSHFDERSLCFNQGELVGLNLLGEGWEILLNVGIQINGIHRLTRVTYKPIQTSASV